MVGVKTRDCLTLEEELRERRFTEHVMSDGCTSPLAAIPTHSCLQSIPMVSKLATHAVLLAATAACAWGASPFSRLSCPKSSPVNTGCYCTSGCSINGDTIFKWNAPLFPPKLLAAPEMGNDTICAISRSRPSPTLPRWLSRRTSASQVTFTKTGQPFSASLLERKPPFGQRSRRPSARHS